MHQEQTDREIARRGAMVQAVRRGQSPQQVARDFGVSPGTVNRGVRHAQGQRRDRVNWSNRAPVPPTTQRTEAGIADVVLELRPQLQVESDVGFPGAEAIRQARRGRPSAPLPAERTIARILRRCGGREGRQRARRPPPPPGWYRPEVARRSRELDSGDVVAGWVIPGGPPVEVLKGVARQGGLVAAGPRGARVTAKFGVAGRIEPGREFGRPGSAQFDNDTICHGPQTPAEGIGRVSRLGLGRGVVPVFVPPRAPGFQAALANSNGSGQATVWGRFEHADRKAWADRSRRPVAALRRHRADRLESAPPRGAFPRRWRLNLQARPKGRMGDRRRTDARGRAEVLGRSFAVDRHWAHRLVRVEVDLDGGQIRFYRLRRREPGDPPLLRERADRIPAKPFH